MNVLQLCYKPPFPPVDGGTLAMNSITEGLLAAGHSVHVLSVCSDKHPVDNKRMTETYRQQTHFESVYIDLSIHPIAAAVALLCGESYNVKRFISKAFDNKLKETLKKNAFDIIHVESIFLAPYIDTIRRHSNAKVVLRTHNVEHLIWRQLAKNTRFGIKRWYLRMLALNLQAYETYMVNKFDGLVCITTDDMESFKKLGCRKPMTSIPFAIAIKEISAIKEEPYSLFHIGSMDWRPNVESIKWFLDKVWTKLHLEMPMTHLYLAGRKMPDDMMKLNIDGVTVLGEVPNADQFIASKQINIVPLLSGSGIRIKIIESMAMGKTVITTSIGAKGINYTNGKDLLIADNPEQFIEQVRLCINRPETCRSIGQEAYNLIQQSYSINAVTEKLVDFYNQL